MLARSLFALLLLAGAAAPASYRVAESLPGPDGPGWDLASVDPDAHRLYVAHGDAVAVFDLTGRSPPRSIGTIGRGHAALPIPHSATLLVTSGQDSTVRLLDTNSGVETARIPVDANPDAAVLDPATGHALVMNAEAGTVSEIDVGRKAVTRTIKLKPGLEFAAIGPRRTLFVNDEDASELEVADLATGKAAAPVPLPGCEGPTGLAYDARTDRLLAACANGKAAVVDATRRRLVGLVEIGRGPDGLLIDPARRLAFVPCGRDGVLDILALDGAAGVRRVATVTTEPGARTGALDPSTGAIYLPTARFDPPAPGAQRRTVQPGSFHVVVVRPAA